MMRQKKVINNQESKKIFFADTQSFTEPSIKRTLLKYALNFIEKSGINNDIMVFAISCLPVKSRTKLVELLYNNSKNHENEDLVKYDFHEDAIDELWDPNSLGNTIMRCISRKIHGFNIQRTGRIVYSFLEDEYRKTQKKEGAVEKRLKDLGEIFNLSRSDLTILKLIYLAYCINKSLLADIFKDITYNEFVRLASTATDLSPAEIRRSLSKSGMLVNCGIIDSISPTSYSFIDIDDTISDYLAGLSEKNFIEKHIRLERGKTLNLEDFSIKAEDTEIITDIFKSGEPCNILLYGIPGTGKTEYAKAIAAASGERVYSVRYGETGSSDNKDSSDRIFALRVAINTVSEKGGILIADEADFLLNTRSFFFDLKNPEKGWLNDLLDNSKAQIIWITNKIGSMEESTLRRFSYSLEFERFTEEQRISVWNNLLKRNPLKKYITSQLVKELSQKYEVNAGSIAASLNALKQIKNTRELKEDEVKPILENLLKKNSRLLKMNIKKENRLNQLSGKYDLSFVNADINIQSVVNAIKKFTSLSAQNENSEGINLLLWGESGTGKTEFVKYLAAQTGRKLIIRRASDLMDMYVGNTEKYIAAAFQEAEDKNAILFIDEADTFLGSRERTVRSWEISHINEFLVQMENFSGVLVCCTNLIEIFDTASMRRFNWKIRFSPLKEEMRLPLYKKYFATEQSHLTAGQKKRISSIEYLTPGHARAVSKRLAYMKGEEIDHYTIIDELEKEASYMQIRKNRRAGFN